MVRSSQESGSEPARAMIFDAAGLEGVPAYQLLEAAGRGYLGVDRRFLGAILDHPEQSIPDLVRFASEDRTRDLVDLTTPLFDLFRYFRTPQSVPFLVSLVRRDPADIDDELVTALADFGAAAVDPLLHLLDEFEGQKKDPGDIPFLLAVLQVRDARILEMLTRHLAAGDPDAALYLDMYGDPAAVPALEAALQPLPAGSAERTRIQSFIENLKTEARVSEPLEPVDILPLYPKEDSPPLDRLSERDHLLMLQDGSPELKIDLAAYYRQARLSSRIEARFLEMARHDPDRKVRGECWQSLEQVSDEPEVRRAMHAVLSDADASLEEKGGAAIALAQQTDNNAVFEAIEKLYADPRGRALALKAMSRSFDRRFAAYPPRHLDDPDPAIKRQAIWAVGYLSLSAEAPRLEAFFEDDAFREDALFAYALSVPAETSRGRIRALFEKISRAARGLTEEEEELVEDALDQRLMLHGRKPVFSAEDSPEASDPEPSRSKIGRNDPCPCGSGKKYKKCCGA